jgi:hypothetical protein
MGDRTWVQLYYSHHHRWFIHQELGIPDEENWNDLKGCWEATYYECHYGMMNELNEIYRNWYVPFYGQHGPGHEYDSYLFVNTGELFIDFHSDNTGKPCVYMNEDSIDQIDILMAGLYYPMKKDVLKYFEQIRTLNWMEVMEWRRTL